MCCGIAKQSLTSGQVVLEGQFNHIVSKAEIEMGAVPSPFIVGTLSCEAKMGNALLHTSGGGSVMQQGGG